MRYYHEDQMANCTLQLAHNMQNGVPSGYQLVQSVDHFSNPVGCVYESLNKCPQSVLCH